MPQDILVLETMCVWHKPERAFRLLSCHPQAHADICDNLVPVEIALRCARAVMAGQAFAAYIIIPMWPEGGQLSISRARGGCPAPAPPARAWPWEARQRRGGLDSSTRRRRCQAYDCTTDSMPLGKRWLKQLIHKACAPKP